ncbi:MAG TPA: LPS export ABC transporter permease LptG [Hypericibacter adhaerens]|uniref:LPS export ABC transporter permease LptG n=1 Tax=Hypericibacter adhaerens TaxID=2602016 RepID=A0A5J6N0Y8_9PROT|nr:LPS export ABC transporter permease LptG [Hypericibacter adhaerens]QEX23147.1 LPS export ABC transporter permease LptG [Hypericibacter adhaerens]HWA45045.1 LPS export ABC transporter permease LptG [Hypericibacter adhaerens]
MKLLPRTLSLYLLRHFLFWCLSVAFGVCAIIFAADMIQLLSDDLTQPGVGTFDLMGLALLRLPQTFQQVLPFVILIAGLGTYHQLTRTSELVVARAAGVSVWQFLAPPLLAALAIGIFRITMLDPVATTLQSKFDLLHDEWFGNGDGNLVATAGSGVWLREQGLDGTAIVHANHVSLANRSLGGIVLLTFDPDDRFHERVDAQFGRIENGRWQLSGVERVVAGHAVERMDKLSVPTRISYSEILDRFAQTSVISFWALPRHISLLESTGFSARPHRLLWHRLLAMPLLYMALLVIAASFALRFHRKGDAALLAGAGAFTGFLLYFLSDLVYALGINSSIPLQLAAWAPAGVTALLGITMLLHFEDG